MAHSVSKAPTVLHATEKGLEGVVVLHEHTPQDVIRWIVRFFNEFFDGGENSFLDKMKDASAVQTQWRAYKKDANMTVTTCGGQT